MRDEKKSLWGYERFADWILDLRGPDRKSYEDLAQECGGGVSSSGLNDYARELSVPHDDKAYYIAKTFRKDEPIEAVFLALRSRHAKNEMGKYFHLDNLRLLVCEKAARDSEGDRLRLSMEEVELVATWRSSDRQARELAMGILRRLAGK